MNRSLPTGLLERDLISEDIPDCADLWNTRMGTGYADTKLLEEASNPSTLSIGKVAYDPIQDTVSGFCIAEVHKIGEAISVPWEKVQEDIPYSEFQTVGELNTIVVTEQKEGKGIGTSLVESVVMILSNSGLPIITETWNRNQDIDGRCIAEGIKLTHITTLPDYWEYSTSDTETCIECHKSPCECSGSLYMTVDNSIIE